MQKRGHTVPVCSPAVLIRTFLVIALAMVAMATFMHFAKAEELRFPAFSAPVVDQAGILSETDQARLNKELLTASGKTGDQLAIATVESLQGASIEDYANRLFRLWKLGQKGQNNGLLLLVAPQEHKVRIEVGRGLEGVITDLVTKMIIENEILPAFKANDYPKGIKSGAAALIAALKSDSADLAARAQAYAAQKTPEKGVMDYLVLGFIGVIAVVMFGTLVRGAFAPRRIVSQASIAGALLAGRRRRGWVGGGHNLPPNSENSGGFSGGGGGDSGGGGASGRW